MRVKQSNPLPNETNSHDLFFVEISVSQVTKTMQISAKLICVCLIAAAVVAGCVLIRAEENRLEPDALFIDFKIKRKYY